MHLLIGRNSFILPIVVLRGSHVSTTIQIAGYTVVDISLWSCYGHFMVILLKTLLLPKYL